MVPQLRDDLRRARCPTTRQRSRPPLLRDIPAYVRRAVWTTRESVRPRLRLRYLSQHRARMAVRARSQLYRPAPTAPLSQLLQRLIKSPKLYFLDPGLAAWLLEIRTAEQLAAHPMRGPLFETWVYSELLKAAANRADRPALFFWRDRAGLEIDFIIDRGTHLIPIEVKSGATFAGDWLEPLERWRGLAGDAAGPGWIIHGGEEEGSRRGFACVPWRRIEILLKTYGLNPAPPP